MSEREDLVSRFTHLSDDTAATPETLPGRLAAAAAVALGVDGASLSLLSLDLRVPLGAGDLEAGVAERLQFTAGEGPCLDVMHGGLPVTCDLAQMHERWPMFARELTAQTSYRAVASVPLPFNVRGDGGALDLYSRDPDGAGVDADDASVVADRIVVALVGSQPATSLAGADDVSKVPWLQSLPARRRMEVWVAMGIVATRTGVDTVTALAALRGWARTHDTDVDAVAADVVSGRLDPALRTG